MVKIGFAGVWVHDQDEALAFYTEKLGWELRADVTLPELGGYRWLTVGPPGQTDVSLQGSGALATGDTRMTGHDKLRPGLYQVNAVLRAKLKSFHVLRHRSGFWIYDDALIKRGKPISSLRLNSSTRASRTICLRSAPWEYGRISGPLGSPGRDRTTPLLSSTRRASRTVERLTANWATSSRSLGRRWPGERSSTRTSTRHAPSRSRAACSLCARPASHRSTAPWRRWRRCASAG